MIKYLPIVDFKKVKLYYLAILEHLSHLTSMPQQIKNRTWKDYVNISAFCPKENSLVFKILAAKSQVLNYILLCYGPFCDLTSFGVAVELCNRDLVSSKLYHTWKYGWLLHTQSLGACNFQLKVKEYVPIIIHETQNIAIMFSVLLLPKHCVPLCVAWCVRVGEWWLSICLVPLLCSCWLYFRQLYIMNLEMKLY